MRAALLPSNAWAGKDGKGSGEGGLLHCWATALLWPAYKL